MLMIRNLQIRAWVIAALLPCGSPLAADVVGAEAQSTASAKASATQLDTVRVVSRARAALVPESVSALDAETIAMTGATHASEMFARLPGVWISRGSGQEQLAAIRSPVLTGTGACGAFLLLEDEVPIRPTAFCNVNQLGELPTELAGGIELLRGPGSAVHGSNALHGVINVLSPQIAQGAASLRLEAGANRWRRLQVGQGDGERWRIDALATDTGSFRRDEDFNAQKLIAQWQAPDRSGAPRLLLSASRLDQNTAGFVFGQNAYRDARRFSNDNPEAFREGHALRLQARWDWLLDGGELSFVPFARSDRQRFLQHFSPGQPLESNGSDSLGAQLLWRRPGPWQMLLGLDIDFANGELLELQSTPLTTGAAALQATRPVGRHYDYRVRTQMLAAFGQWTRDLAPRWQLQAGVRGEQHRFDYDNRAADGNLREDGSACGFGGCLFNRPADRSDRFDDGSARLGLLWQFSADQQLAFRLARAFRVPQAGELYRLQRGQDVADLSTEVLRGVELGWRASGARWFASIDGYDYRKSRVILRDAQGFNISDGRTRHRGIEVSGRWQADARWRMAGQLGWSDQRYDFDRDAAAGEQIRRGNRIDSAPRWLAGVQLGLSLGPRDDIEWEARYQGSYALDAGNSARYPGHVLNHLRWQRELSSRWRLSVRLMNVLDRRYAERADFAFGQFRYFPGAGRELYVVLQWRGE